MSNETTTKFKGDIQFKAGNAEIKCSELPTIDEVNTALENYVTLGHLQENYFTTEQCYSIEDTDEKFLSKTDADSKYILKTDADKNYPTTSSVSSKYATKTELTAVDNKFANYTTTTNLSNNYALKTYAYSKTESDNKYALKTAIPTNYITSSVLNSTLSNYLNGENMLNMLVNSINGYVCPIDYVAEGQKYVSWIEFQSSYLRIIVTNEFTSKRYLIMYIKIKDPLDKNDNIITIIDRKNLNGLAIIYNDEKIHVSQTKWSYNSSNKGYLVDYENTPIDDLHSTLDLSVEEIPEYSSIHLLYFKVIDDGDNKTVAANLLGALMHLSQAENEYKCRNIT